jgi:hypothetical protein
MIRAIRRDREARRDAGRPIETGKERKRCPGCGSQVLTTIHGKPLRKRVRAAGYRLSP